MKYLIFSLGRSRTAWLAQFLPNCGHELLAMGRPLEGLDGLADTSLIVDWRAALQRWPEAMPIVIHRDPAAVRASFERQGVSGKLIANLYPRLRDLIASGAPMFEFDKLDEQLPALWSLISDEPFPLARHRVMQQLNIQMDLPYFQAKADYRILEHARA